MAKRCSLRGALQKMLVSDSDLDAFLIDYFKDDVFNRLARGNADKVAKVNLLLEHVTPGRIGEALADWAERQELSFDRTLVKDERRGERRPPDLLLERVLHACRIIERQHKESGLKLRRLTPRGAALRLIEVSFNEGPFQTRYGLGASDQPVTGALVEEFREALGQQHLLGANARRPQLVFSAGDPDESARVLARRHEILLRRLDDYEILLKIRPAVEAQTARLAGHQQYPPSLYVPQRGQLSHGSGFRFEPPITGVIDQLLRLLHEHEPRFILILGEFGLGKTFLMYELARRLGEAGGPPWPVLCELRNLDKRQSLDSLLAAHMQQTGISPIDPEAFRHLLRLGKIILCFDGFDELALRTTYDRATEHLETLLSSIEGQAKVVLTSRTQHFLSDHQIRTALAQRLERVPTEVLKLLPFQPDQIRQFLRNQLGKKAARRYRLIVDIHDLLGLSENPRMLGFIAALEEKRLTQVREQQGHISAAELYRLILDQWLDFEVQRAALAGHSLTRGQLLAATTQLALLLWLRSERSASVDELEQGATAALAQVGKGGAPLSPAEAIYQVGAGSLLVRDPEGRFSFLHHSVLEWLVVEHAAAAIRDGQGAPVLALGEMSPLMAEFFIDLLGKDEGGGPLAVHWVTEELDRDVAAADWSKRNALRVAERLKEAAPALRDRRLAGQDLRGRDLRGRDLRFTDLSGACLQEASLIEARLHHADLRGADLRDADLRGADVRHADLRGADLSRANLMRADLRGAGLERTVLRRAKLLGTQLDEGALEAARAEDTWAAVPPGATALKAMLALQVGGVDVAFSPDGSVIAVACGTLIGLWDAGTGQPLRELAGHQDRVWSVAWSPDGKTLASASHDRTVRLWDAGTGQPLRELAGHQDGVRSVAWSPDGKTLASASYDRTVRLWDAGTGQPLRELAGHQDSVSSVAWSPDGKTLASASYDRTVRLWDPDTGQPLRELAGHQDRVRSVAWSPDGKTLASGSDDSTVRLWDPGTGQPLRELAGHQARVWSVAWSPDGKTLASGSQARTVRLWDPDTGQPLRELAGHQDWVWSVAWSPDGKTLASASDDGTLRLWATATGQCLAVMRAGEAGWVAFAPDGRYKCGGQRREFFWHVINLCRFECAHAGGDGKPEEPGELDEYFPGLRLAKEASFFDLPPWSPAEAVASRQPSGQPSRPPSPGAKPRRASRKRPPAQNSLFAWLHLSDLHLGHGDAEHGWDQKLVLQELHADVVQVLGTTGVPRPDALLATGDIAFSGATRRANEYQEAAHYLSALAAAIHLTPRDVLLVPGNHDVQRAADQDRNVWRLLRALRAGDDLLDDALGDEADRSLLARRQENYLAFARSFGPGPGDDRGHPFHFRHRLQGRGLSVLLLGLNTALLAADDQDRGRLRLGKRALGELLTDPAPAPEDLVIALSHPPLHGGWLADEKEAAGWVRRHAHIHLCGHVHEAESEEARTGAGGALVRVTAGAAHGDRQPAGVPAGHGYNLAAVVRNEDDELLLRIWPRRWSDKSKDFRLDADNVTDGQPYAEHLLRLD